MDVFSCCQIPRSVWRRFSARRAATILLALSLPLAQTVYAVDIYYARAIGQEYLPERTPPAPTPPANQPQETLPDLPGLGERTTENAAPKEGMGMWTKVLIGTVLVAAIAALGNNGGGGSAGVSVGTGDTPPPTDTGSSGGNGTSGGSGGGGGPGVDVGIGIGSGSDGARGNNRERGRNNGRDRDDDDDD